MRTIIACAGPGTRWNNYMGIPKQMARVNGKPILYRTIEQLRKRGITDIYVACREQGQFGDFDAIEYVQQQTQYDIDRFCGAAEIYEEPTLFLYGDVFYSKEGMDKIINGNTRFYGRGSHSNHMGKYEELFAIKMDDELMKIANNLRSRRESGDLSWTIGWHVYRQSQDIPFGIHKIKDDFTDIDDFTEDFDSRSDYLRWLKNFNHKEPDKVFEHLPKHRAAIHVGGYTGVEHDFYNEVLYVEPLPEYADLLRFQDYNVVEAAIGSDTLYVTSQDDASSILKPMVHSATHEIKVTEIELRDIQEPKHDLLVIDAQGATLKILKSGDLEHFKHIICEASNSPRYENETTRDKIIEYLNTYELIGEYQHASHDIYDLVFKQI